MTIDTTATGPEATQEPPEAPEAPAPEPTDQEPTEDTKAGREAARYRTQLRETEGERDRLREQVASLQRAAVDGIAGNLVLNPAGVWASGLDVATVLNEDGTVDPAKAEAAVRSAAETLGLSPKPAIPIGARSAPAGKPAPDPTPDRLVDAFKPPRLRADDAAYRR